MTLPWYFPLVLAAGCLVLWLILRLVRFRQPAGFPEGTIVYRGHGRIRAPLLHAPDYHLTGMPDYIVQTVDGYVPVEVKSATKSKKLFMSDRMQLVAEALLVEAKFGKRPEHGYVIYSNGWREVSIRPKDIDKLSKALQVMRDAKRVGDMPDVSPSWFYCPTCPKTNCPVRAKRRRPAGRKRRGHGHPGSQR